MVDQKLEALRFELVGDALRLGLVEDPSKSVSNGEQTFRSRFARSQTVDLKRQAAQDRLEASRGMEQPAARCFFLGKPDPHEFRSDQPDPDKVPPGAPPFITSSLGRAWPKFTQIGEGHGPSAINQANPPGLKNPSIRLAMTENIHPAARSRRSGMVSDAA